LPIRDTAGPRASSANSMNPVTPAGLKSFYHITGTGSSSTSQSVFEILGQTVSPSDLASFQNQFSLPSQTIANDIGGHESDSQCAVNPNSCIEANSDVQYMLAVSPGTPLTYWYDTNQYTPYEDWIEKVASSSNPPKVASISYGALEPELSSSVMNAFNTEAMKLGAQGVSVFVSSGDDGVANFQARGDQSACGYIPSFPASSPFVTAIGATQGGINGGSEIACSASTGGGITSGGGFSGHFSAPSYQTSQISDYFSALSTAPESGYAAGGRGYPDVSMAGADYEVVVGGQITGVCGTSLSSPVVAGMAAMVNAQLGTSIGFINPTLYAAASGTFNDITQGDNKCTASSACCSQGFAATTGWDPVTGLGSVDFVRFKDLFSSLAHPPVVV